MVFFAGFMHWFALLFVVGEMSKICEWSGDKLFGFAFNSGKENTRPEKKNINMVIGILEKHNFVIVKSNIITTVNPYF